ncbi:glycosyltransferase family 4 protein [Pseudarthrobacter enclensis]|uniref:glycosyltransferase family 4 protein n=1 Tax=Pseudarthrobacter enclensis TaxID=993070 RepID=UPI003EE38201
MGTTNRSFEVFFPGSRDIAAWENAHASGKVPDKWPYGLHRVRSRGNLTPRAVIAESLNSTDIVKQFLFQELLHLTHKRPDSVAISWEEDLALRMATKRPKSSKFTGVIWASDRVARGEKTLKDMMLKRFLPGFSGLWVLSRAQIDVLEDWLGTSTPPIDFLRFGIDSNFFVPEPYPEGPPVVLSIGRDRDRDAATLFEAFDSIRRVRPDVELAVQLSDTSSLPPGVIGLPPMPHAELRNLYRRASVVVVATRPNLHVSGMTVALESMATARPVVVCDTPGMTDYVEDGVTGRLVRPRDPVALADATLELLSDRETARRMGLAGRYRVEKLHSSEGMAKSLTKIIQKRS